MENRGEPRPPYRTDARRWREDAPFPIAADTFFTEKRLIPNTELKDIFEAPFVFKRNGIYYFTYSSGSCHTDTYRVQYAVSKTGPMGPFEYKGELLTTNEDETVHGPGHHSIIEVGGRYYIVYHRHNNPKSVHGFNRQVCIDELKFDEQGNILPVIPTHNAQGVFPLITHPSPLTPHPSPLTTHPSPLTNNNLAYGATVTASSYYDEWFKPEYAVDDNNATLWKAANTNWGRGRHQDEWLQIDLGKARKFTEVWTQFEYATFFYQYKIETSLDGQTWTLYADRTGNTLQGSPMTDKGKAKARYIRITITDTQKNGHIPAIWNVKVWQKAPELPPLLTSEEEQGGGVYPGMHQKDVEAGERLTDTSVIIFDAAKLAKDAKQPFDVTEIETYSKDDSRPSMKFTANKPIRMRVKDGKWALFLNGTQSLSSELPLPQDYRYNAPYTIMASVMSTKVGPVSTVASLSTSRADLATTEFRLGTDPATGLLNHNGSFESCGAPQDIKAGEGKWQLWVITYDGWMERAYVDGRLVREQNNFLMVRPEGHITIGADGSGANNFMGYINMIAIAPVATPAADIQEMYKMLSQVPVVPSLGDDDFEEIDPDSKFVLSPDAKAVFEQKEEFTLSAPDGAFNDDPLQHGATVYQEVEGDFVVMCTLSDMEGLATHSVKGYNEGGILIADGTTYYQLGAFPLYNCGNMFTVLSSRGRPQFPNYKGYDLDRYMQFERRGNQLFARTSADGKTWSNMPGSPVDIKGQTLRIGAYQTTYTDQPSWVKLRDFVIYQ